VWNTSRFDEAHLQQLTKSMTVSQGDDRAARQVTSHLMAQTHRKDDVVSS